MSADRQEPPTSVFEAVIADMDGVLTQTRALHYEAWKQTFDAFLAARASAQRPFEPFSDEDYRAFVDGRRREEGIRSFLSSRGLVLDAGEPSDGPEADTEVGLGQRKNRRYLERLAAGTVEVHEDTLAALARWRRGGLRLGLVSASRNSRLVLERAGLMGSFDAIVGGEVAQEMGLGGKADQMREAARRLGVAPVNAVVLEDATSGVAAARAAGFGWVVGVDRVGRAADLRAAGADDVVCHVTTARFPRRLPSALAHTGAIETWCEGCSVAVFLDYDGTLTPIVARPGDAHLSEDMRAMVRALAERAPVAIISGRDREDVEARVRVDGVFYAGSHGLDIRGPGHQKTLPEARAVVEDVDAAERGLGVELGNVPGVVLERKPFSLAVHYRMVERDADVALVAAAVERWAAQSRLRKRAGKKVLELEPAVPWDKGRAVRWLMEVLGLDARETRVLYIGDDETDEDVFAVLGRQGLGIRVGEAVAATLADYRLRDPGEVQAFLAWLIGRPTGRS
jgi:trehalose 6-phosphate phosphatase